MSFSIPLGFRFAGVHAGIKKNPNKEDLTLVHCPSRRGGGRRLHDEFGAMRRRWRLIGSGRRAADIRVVVVNSGNANACTGERGMADAREMARLAAEAVGAKENQALVMSTGVIGHFLPMDKIAAGRKDGGAKLGRRTRRAFPAAARGILTTDKGVRSPAARWKSAARPFAWPACAKGRA